MQFVQLDCWVLTFSPRVCVIARRLWSMILLHSAKHCNSTIRYTKAPFLTLSLSSLNVLRAMALSTMEVANSSELSPSAYAAESKDNEAEETLLPSSPPSLTYPRRSRTRTIGSHILTCLITVLLWTFVLATFRSLSSRTTIQPTTKYLHCGNSTAEARARDCVFDVLTNMWVPKQCWDREGTDEYMRMAPWQGYDTQEATRRLTLEEMSERVGKDRLAPDPTSPPYWTPLREHVIHCALMWQRQHRGFMNGESKKLDFHSLNYQHTLHCSRSLMHMAGAGDEVPDPLDKVAVRTWVGFSDCYVEA